MPVALSGVEIWLVDLARSGVALAAAEDAVPRLSDDERRRASELSRNGDDWRLIRVALRLLLERAVGPKLRRVPFRISAHGKPALPWNTGIAFSVSHSGRRGLIAISSSEVGVDIEHERRVHFPQDRQQAMLAAARALVPELSDDDARRLTNLHAWDRLEAWGKARGTGVGALLHDLGIRGSDRKASAGTMDIGKRATRLLRQEGFGLQDLALPLPLHGAVATRLGSPLLPVRGLPADLASLEALAPPA